MTQEWAEVLFVIWKNGRKEPAWMDLYSVHDEEDQRYFDMLDSMVKSEGA